jgi:hypothetical protein
MKGFTLMGVFVVGMLVGGGTVELVHRSTDQRSKLTFARKLKCQILATAYVKNDANNDAIIAVDFSPSRNSCVVALTKLYPQPLPFRK